MARKSILLAILLMSVYATKGQQRMSLYELFTSETCPPSAIVDSQLFVRMHSGHNPEHVQFLCYITPYPSPGGGVYFSDRPDYDARSSYYTIPFVSYGRLDGKIPDGLTGSGHGFPPNLLQDTLDSVALRPAPFNIDVSFVYDTVTSTVDIATKITCVAPYSTVASKLKVRTALVRTLDYIAPPGGTTMKHFENMVRLMYPNAGGSVLDSAWNAGDTLSFSMSGPVPTEESILYPHTASLPEIVVWIQDDNDKVILQSARATLPAPVPVTLPVINASQSTLAIYPNPAKNKVAIAFDMPIDGAYYVYITDVLGRLVYSSAQEGYGGKVVRELPINTLSAGAYNVYVQTTSGNLSCRMEIAD